MIGITPEQLHALEEAVETDPGASCFPALAEVHRRAGRLREAERVVRSGLDHKDGAADGQLVLGLVLLDQGRVQEAREVLEPLTVEMLTARAIFVDRAPDADLSEAELDDAFERAETDTDELIDPNRVAEEAVVQVDAAAGDGLEEDRLAPDDAPGEAGGTFAEPVFFGEAVSDDLEPGSTFATATMAELLERQGDEQSAQRIRASLEVAAAPRADVVGAETFRRQRLLDTLERWLTNIRGDGS